MGVPSIMNSGRTGMVAAQASIATTGHNINNANTDGYSRQRVLQAAETPGKAPGGGFIGQGTKIERIERLNDEYLEKQLRQGNRDISEMEEKEASLKQVEDIFNEMSGDGMNRLMTAFFNEFRKLANDPDSEAVRQSVREATQALVNDFHRIQMEVNDVRKHIDARIEGYVTEVNDLTEQLKEINQRIQTMEVGRNPANDLLDKRDEILKKLYSYMDLATHKDKVGAIHVDIVGVGPLVTSANAEKFTVQRTKADEQGKPENALEIRTTATANSVVTHRISGGKLGGLISVRDQTLSTIENKLNDLAYTLTRSVNEIHSQGITRNGTRGVAMFKTLTEGDKSRAAEVIQLSDEVRASINNISTAALSNSPGDNRIAQAISSLQGLKLMNEGRSTMDDYYNSIVSDVGVVTARNRSALNQQKNINTQMSKLREQISGVSLDEETANLLQFQHAFDASAKVIQVADRMLDTVLNLKR